MQKQNNDYLNMFSFCIAVGYLFAETFEFCVRACVCVSYARLRPDLFK